MKRAFFLLLWMCVAPSVQAATVQEVVSKGGKVAWLVEDSTVPAFTISVLVPGAGSAYDPKGKNGLAVLAASLLSEGAGDRDSAAFHDTLDFHALRFSASALQDDLDITFTSLSEHQELAFSLLHDVLASPRFDAPDLARVKAQQHATIRQNKGDANYQAARGLYAELFPSHAYGKPAIGTLKTVAALTREDMQNYVQYRVRGRPMIISVSGDLSASRLKELMETHLDTLPKPEAQLPPLESAEASFGKTAHKAMEVPQTVVYFALPGIKRSDKDYYAAFIMNHLLGGSGLSSRLGKEIREKRGLAYYAYSGLVELDQAALLTGSFATRNDQVDEAAATLKEVIRTLGDEGFAAEEFEEGVAYLTGSFPAKLTSNRSVVAYLESMQRYGLGKDYLEKRNAYLQAVTHAEVNAVTKRLFKPENLVIMAAGKPAKAVLNKENGK